ncbi:MAG TPA: heparan-alpha-glucosaminide N-acetyltransferase domain-containing protein [Aeromicrobium sp.]|nr:heparan-alpha-glucosaminide N-acetyltransferase domain-containing protein [Aeromicrobium sp.]
MSSARELSTDLVDLELGNGPVGEAESKPSSPSTRVLGRVRDFGRPPRIMGLDVARGLAVLGMAAAHMAQVPTLHWSDPATWGGIVTGRSAILFAVLAGISVSLTNGRTKLPSAADLPRLRLKLLGRGTAIFLIGIALELLNTGIAVILGVYGLLFIAAIPFLRFRVRHLFIAAACFALAGPALLAVLSVLSLSAQGPALNISLFGTYPLPAWLALMLLGMALGRLRIDSLKVASWVLLGGITLAVSGYAAGAAVAEELGFEHSADSSPAGGDSGSKDLKLVPGEQVDASGMECEVVPGEWISCAPPAIAESQTNGTGGAYLSSLTAGNPRQQILSRSLSVAEHSGGTFELIASGGFALAVIGACLLLARPLRWVLIPIAALGSMPLTTYAAHIVVYVVLAGQPLGEFPSGLATWAWVSVGLVTGATVWAMTLGRGPLERLVARSANWMARGA